MQCLTSREEIAKFTSNEFAAYLYNKSFTTQLGRYSLSQILDVYKVHKFSITSDDVVTFEIIDEEGNIEDLSKKVNFYYTVYTKSLKGLEYNDKIKDEERKKYFDGIYGTTPKALVREFNDFVFLSRDHFIDSKVKKKFINLTSYAYGSSDNIIQNILDSFLKESEKNGVLSTLKSKEEKERYVADLKSHLAGFKAILLSDVNEEDSQEEEENPARDGYRESNGVSPTSYTDALFRLYLSSLTDENNNILNAQSLLLKLLKDFSGLNAEEVVEKLRDANKKEENSYLKQIYTDLFEEFDIYQDKLNEIIPVNSTNKIAKTEILNQKKKLLTGLEFIRYVGKATTLPFNVVRNEAGDVFLNDSIQETTENKLVRAIGSYITTTSKSSNKLFGLTRERITVKTNYIFEKPLTTNISGGLSVRDSNIENLIDIAQNLGIINAVFNKSNVDNKTEFTNYLNSLTSSQLLEFAQTFEVLLESLSKVDPKITDFNVAKVFTKKEELAVYRGIYNNFISVFKFINDTYSLFPKESTYYKGDSKPVYAISLAYSAYNRINELKKRFSKEEVELDAQELYLAEVLKFIDSKNLNIIELVQFADVDKTTEFGFMSSHSYETVSLAAIGLKNAIPSLRAADRSLERAFTGFIKLQADSLTLNQDLISLLEKKLVSELVTHVILTKGGSNNIFTNALQGSLFYENIRGKKASPLAFFKDFFDAAELDTLVDTFNATYPTEEDLNPDSYFDEIKKEALKHVQQFLENKELAQENIKQRLFDTYVGPEIEYLKKVIPTHATSNTQEQYSYDTIRKNFGITIADAFAAGVENKKKPFVLVHKDALAQELAVRGLIGRLIQQPIIFGNLFNYTVDGFKKRTTLYYGTRESAPDNELSNKIMDALYPKLDGTLNTSEVSYHVIPEISKSISDITKKYYRQAAEEEGIILGKEKGSKELEEFIENKIASQTIDVADATAWNSLAYAMSTLVKDGGLSFDEAAEAAIIYESQLKHFIYLKLGITKGDLIPNSPDADEPLISIEQFNRIYQRHLKEPITQEFIDSTSVSKFTPQFYSEKIKIEYLTSNIPIKKDQGAGPVESITDSLGNTYTELPKQAGLQALIKTAPNTLIPSNTQALFAKSKEEALQDAEFALMAIMDATKIDLIGVPSGEKTMKKGMGGISIDLKLEGGEYKTIVTVDSNLSFVPKRTISRKNFSKQLETGYEDKNKVTLSTQLRRLALLNLIAINDKIGKGDEIRKIAKELHSLLNIQADSKFIEKIKGLGFPVSLTSKIKDNGEIDHQILVDFNLTDVEGTINIQAVDSFIDGLKSQFTRDGYTYVLQTLDEIKRKAKETGLVLFDLSTQKTTIEQTLSKAVQGSNKVKVKGESLIQETGILKDPNLKMYEYQEGNTFISEAEVIVALPKSLTFFVQRHYRNNHNGNQASFPEMLDYFNKTIVAKENTKKGLKEPSLFTFIANRIPTQSHASIEVFTVKKFTMPHTGGRVALPLDFVFKSGSDFDVDKLTAYLTSIEVDSDNNLFIPYSDLRAETINKSKYTNDIIESGYSFSNFETNLANLSNYNPEFTEILNNLKELKSKLEEDYKKQREYQHRYNKVLKRYDSLWMQEYEKIYNKTTSEKRNLVNSKQAILLNQALKDVNEDETLTYDEIIDYLNDIQDVADSNLKKFIINSEQFIELRNTYESKLENVPDAVLRVTAPFNIISNNVVASMREAILHPSNIAQLYTPVAAPITQAIANYYDTKAVKGYHNLLSFKDEIEAFKAFIGAAIPLGQSATANAFHALAQLSPIVYSKEKIKDQLNLIFNNKIQNTSIGYPYDFDGNSKALVYNEQISGFVDVAKDPFIMRVGINAMNYNLFLSLHEIFGIPYEIISLSFKLPFLHAGIVDESPSTGLLFTASRLGDLIEEIKKYNILQRDVSYKPSVTKEWLKSIHEKVNKNPYFFDNLFFSGEKGKENIKDTSESVIKNLGLKLEDYELMLHLVSVFQQVQDNVAPAIKTIRELLRPDSTFANNKIEISILAAIRDMVNSGRLGFDSKSVEDFINNTHIKAQIEHQFSLTNNKYNVYSQTNGLLSSFFLLEHPTFQPVKEFIVNTVLDNNVSASEREKSLPRIEDALVSLVLIQKFIADKYKTSDFLEIKSETETINPSKLEELIKQYIQDSTNPQKLGLFAGRKHILLDFLNKFTFYPKYLKSGRTQANMVRLLDVSNIKTNTGEQLDFSDLFSTKAAKNTLINNEDNPKNALMRLLVNHLMVQYGLINGPNPWKNIVPPKVFFDVILEGQELSKLYDYSPEDVEHLMQYIVQINSPTNNSSKDLSVLATDFKGIREYTFERKPKKAYINKDKKTGEISLNLQRASEINPEQTEAFLRKLQNNPYVKTTIFESNEEGGSIKIPHLLIFDKIVTTNTSAKAVFKRLNTVGQFWNIFYDMPEGSSPTNIGGYSSIIPNNNVGVVENQTRSIYQKDRILDIERYINNTQKTVTTSQNNTGEDNICKTN